MFINYFREAHLNDLIVTVSLGKFKLQFKKSQRSEQTLSTDTQIYWSATERTKTLCNVFKKSIGSNQKIILYEKFRIP